MQQSASNENEAVRRPVRLGAEVYDYLYAQLMSLKIPPGGRIAVDKLVRTLGVSQTPIREALSRLEEQGLVVKTHLVGYRAAEQMDRHQLEQLYEMRLVLEPFAASRLAAKADSEVIANLKALDAEMLGAHSPDVRTTYGEFARHDSAFHNYIAKQSGNDILHASLARLHTHVNLFRLYFLARATTDANVEHARIIQAIAERDPEQARKAMEQHVECSRMRFMAVFAHET